MVVTAARCSRASASPVAVAKAQSGSLTLHPQQDDFPKSWGTSYSGKMFSQALGQDRVIHVYLPASFNTNTRKYPIIFLGDGEYYYEATVTAQRKLAAVGHIPECIVVAVETPERRNDMTPKLMGNQNSDGDARAEKFLTFLAKELKPEIAARFRGGAPCVLIGHSHGGLLCHYAAADWRKDFPFIVSLDAPAHLQDRWPERRLANSIPAGGNLRLVSLEVRFGWTDKDWANFTAKAPKNWKLIRAKLPDEDHEMMYFDGAYNGLKMVFGDYSAAKTKQLPGPDVFAYYENLAKEYGAFPMPPKSLLDRAMFELSYTGNGPAARRALAMMTEGYGEPEDRAKLEQDIDKAEQMMKGKESVAQLLASPHPTEEQMRPYLGVWKEIKAPDEPGSEAETTVTLKTVNGIGQGQMITTMPNGEKLVQDLVFMRMTSDGIEFGFMNGMHPRGVIAHGVRLNGGKLVGKWDFKGVYMEMPGMQRNRSLEFVRVSG
ncbi:MAG: hypothetical protein JSS72_05860 [Armatimonadetes bacterium]|nr:hypothetical protein [Armatimonadota bacterium]